MVKLNLIMDAEISLEVSAAIRESQRDFGRIACRL
jgi:hypothetical protein